MASTDTLLLGEPFGDDVGPDPETVVNTESLRRLVALLDFALSDASVEDALSILSDIASMSLGTLAAYGKQRPEDAAALSDAVMQAWRAAEPRGLESRHDRAVTRERAWSATDGEWDARVMFTGALALIEHAAQSSEGAAAERRMALYPLLYPPPASSSVH